MTFRIQDPIPATAFWKDRPLDLTPAEVLILKRLMTGEVITVRSLRTILWRSRDLRSAVKVHMSKIRKAFRAIGVPYEIKPVYIQCYQLERTDAQA